MNKPKLCKRGYGNFGAKFTRKRRDLFDQGHYFPARSVGGSGVGHVTSIDSVRFV